MVTRLFSAIIAVPIGILILYIDNIYLLISILSILSMVATYEMFVATKYIQSKWISAISIIFAGIIPSVMSFDVIHQNIAIICFGFLLTLFLVMLLKHEKVKFEQITFVAFVSICIPVALNNLALIRINFPEHGQFYLVFTLISAWIGDAGAYFIGTFFGKHKMATSISPKKTWEGFFGGLVTSALFAVLLGYAYEFVDYMATGVNHFKVNILMLAVIAVLCAGLGVIGDLSASIVKRQCQVKDFGNIMPGHGGVLDRFDSVLFVAPFVYLVLKFVEMVNPI